jgi:hypothetical protein
MKFNHKKKDVVQACGLVAKDLEDIMDKMLERLVTTKDMRKFQLSNDEFEATVLVVVNYGAFGELLGEYLSCYFLDIEMQGKNGSEMVELLIQKLSDTSAQKLFCIRTLKQAARFSGQAEPFEIYLPSKEIIKS